ncbi:MAG: hypothetical protein ACUVQP_00105, partial [Bacteroidales bacterium]
VANVRLTTLVKEISVIVSSAATPLSLTLEDSLNIFDNAVFALGQLFETSDSFDITDSGLPALYYHIRTSASSDMSLSLLDSPRFLYGLVIFPSDDLNYGSDATKLFSSLEYLFSSDLNNYTDQVAFTGSKFVRLYSSYLLTEWLFLKLAYDKQIQDSLSSLENLLLDVRPVNAFSDSLSVSDDNSIQMFININLAPSDSMSMSDYFNGTDFIRSDDYIRRYLNDRLFKIGDVYSIFEEVLELSDNVNIQIS